jgi:uncharacterized protein YbcI
VYTGDSTTATAKEELGGHLVSPATRKHAIIEVFCDVRAAATYRRLVVQLRNQVSAQAPILSNSDTVATVVHQIMTELSESVPEKDRMTVITKMILNLMQENIC